MTLGKESARGQLTLSLSLLLIKLTLTKAMLQIYFYLYFSCKLGPNTVMERLEKLFSVFLRSKDGKGRPGPGNGKVGRIVQVKRS